MEKEVATMPMKARTTAKDWLNTLNQMQLERVCSLKQSTSFAQFLVHSDMNTLETAHYASECLAAGVPIEYTTSSEALHYLTIAIANYINGNA
jgi:hypothetical protein